MNMGCVSHVHLLSVCALPFPVNSHKFPCLLHQYVGNLNPYDYKKRLLSPFGETDLRLALPFPCLAASRIHSFLAANLMSQ